jgi:hypothetical protein
MIGMDNKVIRAVISIFAALGAFVVAFLSVFIPWMISDAHHAPHDGQNGMAGFLVGIPVGAIAAIGVGVFTFSQAQKRNWFSK